MRRMLLILLFPLVAVATASLARAEVLTVVEAWRGGAYFFHPYSVSVNPTDGSCWVADSSNNQVVHLGANGAELWRGGGFSWPRSVSVDTTDGSCWVADTSNNQVVHLGANGAELWRGGGFSWPRSVSVDTSDGSCWVADTGSGEVAHLSSSGAELWRGGGFSGPYGISANPTDGSCWVADTNNYEVVHLSASGAELWRGGGFSMPLSVSVNPTDGSCWVADWAGAQVAHLSESGSELWRGGGFISPQSVSANAADGSCWVALDYGNVVVHLSASGEELWVGGGFDDPWCVSVNSADGSCWVADTWHSQVVHLVLVPVTFTGTTERVSVASDGSQGNEESWWAALSAEGRYVAFDSEASNLVAGDTNGYLDTFVHDRQTGETERVSVASNGTQADNASGSPAISADGRYVAFVSDATNLVTGDTNGYRDVLVHDRQTHETERVSVASNGTQGNEWSGWPVAISGDGRYVAWVAFASNLVTGDTNGVEDVFVRDRETGQTERVSVGAGGTQSNELSYSPAISRDGRHVAFVSYASNLVPGDTNGAGDIFVRDRQAEQTQRVSVASDGTQGDGWCLYDYGSFYVTPGISGDGRYVTFWSLATNLVPGDTNGYGDIFVHDRQTGGTERASVSSEGTQGDGLSLCPALSADGRYVGFSSEATTLVPGDTNGWSLDVFVHDRVTHATERVSVANYGTQGNDDSMFPVALSADGRHVAFPSLASVLVPYDTNFEVDAFVRDRVTETGFYGSLNSRGKAPLVVTFTDLSAFAPSGPAIAWAWDFGDGATSTEENPTHEYANPGAYTVTLIATRPEGPLTTTKEGYIKVSFSDVAICPPDPADYWALGYILACVDAGIVQGYSDGTYRPTVEVKRDQMAVYIARALCGGDDHVPSGPAEPTFTDVLADHWAYKYIEYCVANYVVVGYGDNTYRPGVKVNRGQMAAYVARAIYSPRGIPPDDLPGYVPPLTPSFPDVPTDYPFYRHIEYVLGAGVVQGYGDGTYRPATIVNRGQMAVYVARAFALPM